LAELFQLRVTINRRVFLVELALALFLEEFLLDLLHDLQNIGLLLLRPVLTDAQVDFVGLGVLFKLRGGVQDLVRGLLRNPAVEGKAPLSLDVGLPAEHSRQTGATILHSERLA